MIRQKCWFILIFRESLLQDESIAKQKIAEWKTLEIPNIDVYVAPELFERVMSEKIHRGMVPSEKRYEEI